MTFGERITYIRVRKGITQEKLAKMVGVSRRAINIYENDKADPRLLIATCIADALGVTLDYLVKGDENEKMPLS